MTGTTVTVSVATTPSNTNGSDRRETDDIFSRLFIISLQNVILNRVVDVLLHVAVAFLSPPDQCAFNSSVTATYWTVYWQVALHTSLMFMKSKTKSRKGAESASALTESCSGPQCQPASCPQWNINWCHYYRTGGLKYNWRERMTWQLCHLVVKLLNSILVLTQYQPQTQISPRHFILFHSILLKSIFFFCLTQQHCWTKMKVSICELIEIG